MTLKDFDNKERIKVFISQAPRHKLVVALDCDTFPYADSINIGQKLSQYIRNTYLSDIRIQTREYLNQTINDNVTKDKDYGNYVFIHNIGILFEPELGFNVTDILAKLSINRVIIVQIPGVFKYPFFHFINSNSPHKINLSQLNYITI